MAASQWVALTLSLSIGLMVLGFGLSVTWGEATYLLRRPALLARAALAMSVVMPVVAAILASRLDVPLEVKIALVALAVSPVPPMIQRNQLASGGRMEYVAGLLVAMAVLSVVLAPLAVVFYGHYFHRDVALSPLPVARAVLVTVLAPLGLGLLLRHWHPALERASGRVMLLATVLLLVVSAVVVYGLWPTVLAFIGNGTVLVLAAMALVGLAVGHLLGGPIEGDRTALAMSTASRHPAVALAVTTADPRAGAPPELAVILIYLVVAMLLSLPYQKWRSRVAAAAPVREPA